MLDFPALHFNVRFPLQLSSVSVIFKSIIFKFIKLNLVFSGIFVLGGEYYLLIFACQMFFRCTALDKGKSFGIIY